MDELRALQMERKALRVRVRELDKLIAEREWALYGSDCVSLSAAGRELAPLLGKSEAGARMWVTRKWARDAYLFVVNPKNGRPHVRVRDLARVRKQLEARRPVGQP